MSKLVFVEGTIDLHSNESVDIFSKLFDAFVKQQGWVSEVEATDLKPEGYTEGKVVSIEGTISVRNDQNADAFADIFVEFVETHDWLFFGITKDSDSTVGREHYGKSQYSPITVRDIACNLKGLGANEILERISLS